MERRTIDQMDLDFLNKVMHLNLNSSFLTIKHSLPFMSEGSSIVNFASQAGRDGGGPGASAYASSKGAVDSFTKGLAHEYAEHGIRVNCVRPGLIATDIWESTIGLEAAIELGKTGSMLKRIGEPEEVAKMVLWLCSDEASYVTAAIYDVDGGRGNRPA